MKKIAYILSALVLFNLVETAETSMFGLGGSGKKTEQVDKKGKKVNNRKVNSNRNVNARVAKNAPGKKTFGNRAEKLRKAQNVASRIKNKAKYNDADWRLDARAARINQINRTIVFHEKNYNKGKLPPAPSTPEVTLNREHIKAMEDASKNMILGLEDIVSSHGKESPTTGVNHNEILKNVKETANFTEYFKGQPNQKAKAEELSLHCYNIAEAAALTCNMRVIDAVVNSLTGKDGDVVPYVRALKVNIDEDYSDVSHLFPNQKNVTYDEILTKHNDLEESYTIALSHGNMGHADQIKIQMEMLAYAAGAVFAEYIKAKNTTTKNGIIVGELDTLFHDNIAIDMNKLNELIEDEKLHLEQLKKMPGEEMREVSAREMLLSTNTHLVDTLDNGTIAEKHTASREILNRAIELGDYDTIKYVKSLTQDDKDGLDKNHSELIKLEEVSVGGKTYTLEELENHIENGQFTEAQKKELVEVYANCIRKYAEKYSSKDVWTIKIPEGDINSNANSHHNIMYENIRVGTHNNNQVVNSQNNTNEKT